MSQHSPPPPLEVVIPVFNAGPQLRGCIESILQQSLPRSDFSITIVDNMSDDGCIEAVEDLPVRVLREEGKRSSYAARNRGIQESLAQVIAFTDADCTVDPEWLAALYEHFKDERIVAVGGRVIGGRGSSGVAQFLNENELFERYQDDPTFHMPLLTNNVAFRRTVLERLGRFRENWYTGSDVELAWRIQAEGTGKVIYERKAIVYHNHRSTLRGLARQFRRHGFGEVLLDAAFADRPGYGRPPRSQLRQILRQLGAMITYCRSIVYRSLVSLWRETDQAYVRAPRYWLVAESATVYGKLQGLWATRFFLRSPVEGTWTDPRTS